MIKDKWDHEIRETARGIAPASGRISRTAAGSPPAVERGAWSRVLLKHWSWILLITAAVTAGAGALAETQTPIYKAQAEVAVYPPSWAGSAVPIVLGTEKGIASSGAVLSNASQSLLIPESTLKRGLSISIPVDTDLLVVSFSDPDPQVAQSVADGIANAYVQYRTPNAPPSASGNTSGTPSTAETVKAVVITNATLPTSPVSPQRLLIIGAALILGLALGIAAALILDKMDDGLRSPLDLETQAEAPVLAQIPAVYRKKGSNADGLVLLRNPSSTIAEAYRNLRTRVLQVAEWRRANVLLVTSPNREDKTTVAANLAAALALSGRRVVLVSADLRWGRAHALFGLDNRLGLTNLVNGDATLAETLRWTEVSRLQVLPGGQAYFDPSSVLQSTAFRNLLDELRGEADFVVIDAPPVLAGADTAALAEIGAMILLVADGRASTRAEVRNAMRDLGHVHDDVIGCVLDNVGRARRLPQASIAAAMRSIKERAYSDRGFTAAPDGNARPEPEGDGGPAASVVPETP
jgi:capsular exopolysaccharide synthesis family protein